MKFDSNRAWKQASTAISANRDVLLALAGVFYLLPGLAFGLLLPAPEPTAGMDEEAMLAMMTGYYASASPFLILAMLFQAAGTLALLTLLTDKARPTVGEAIKSGFGNFLFYVLAQIILGLGILIVAAIVLAMAGATGLPLIVGVALVVVAGVAIYAAVKSSLVAPVIAVEGQRNPLEALKRSWLLTRGNGWRLGLFYALVAVAFTVVILIATAFIGIIAALLVGQVTGEVIATVVSATLSAVMALYFVAIVAAAHRQLAGPSPEAESRPFE
ncbi:hypothetical protein GCM10011371_20900 [Novosphingobium marinum]|uniref:DUF7847 domain-containing protein n=1 Tax=Novosphingobium marinum TaxID=1514948 RepID=A0A7Z0BWF5_9SPHN|nr:glycerophosphoryl diester phosphodiesterase membrane domain-containing protein [Novosphingobium marinum]NYH96202.1 hypothetical protein [Novosphingobium marinum]GGC33261.1 hypothetical protein GCM10011371_20900 [Novosphingobium marinum]